MSRIAIIGAGNLGSFLYEALCASGHEVFFCVRRPLNFGGRFFLEDPPRADLTLLTVKTYDNESARTWLPLLDAPVAVIQNGVHHEERVAPWPAIPVLSYVYVENGKAYAPPREHFTIPDTAEATLFADLFRDRSITIRREAEFHTAAWRKCLHNCVSNPLTAIAGRGLEILREPHYRTWAERILGEAIPIAQADGAEVTADEPTLDILASYPPGTRTSMLQDRERGKPLEIDSLNGAVVRLGRRFGLPTSVNEEILAALSH